MRKIDQMINWNKSFFFKGLDKIVPSLVTFDESRYGLAIFRNEYVNNVSIIAVPLVASLDKIEK